MTVPPWKKELTALVGVLEEWSRHTTEQIKASELRHGIAGEYRTNFERMGAGGEPSSVVSAYARVGDKARWTQLDGYFSAAAVETRVREESKPDTLWPLVSISLRVQHDHLEMTARVGVFFEDKYGSVDAYGWRFDSADSDGDGTGNDFHHYAHVQQISGWVPEQNAFVPPSWQECESGRESESVEKSLGMLETRPALPIACTTPAGLLAASIISLYGGRGAATILRSVGRSVQAEMERIMAGQSLQNFL